MSQRLLIALSFVVLLLVGGLWNPRPGSASRFDSARWIEAGLERESKGDLSAAERDFLQAAQVDHLYQPRWTLAGYYFRRADEPHFWRWTQLALSIGQRDLGALFDLCWRVTGDPDKISAAMPDHAPVRDEYLSYLMSTNRWSVAGTVAARIAPEAGANELPLLMNYCDAALAHHDHPGAAVVWRSLCRRGLLPFPAAQLLTNGDFRSAPSGRGFDWTAPSSPGLTSTFRSGEATFVVNGSESDHLRLLEQPLALDPSAHYRLSFELKTSGMDSIYWQAGDTLSAPLTGSATFDFPGDAPSLALVYQRRPSMNPAEGSISIRHLVLVKQ